MEILISFKSIYSALKSTIKINEIVEFAVKRNIQFLLISDFYSLASIIALYKKANASNIKIIIGFSCFIFFKRKEFKVTIFCYKNENLSDLIFLFNNINLKKLNFGLNGEIIINTFKKILCKNLSIIVDCDTDFRLSKKFIFNLKNIFKYVYIEYEISYEEVLKSKIKKLSLITKCNTLLMHEVFCMQKSDVYILDILKAIDSKDSISNIYKNKNSVNLCCYAEYIDIFNPVIDDFILNSNNYFFNNLKKDCDINLDNFYNFSVKKIPLIHDNSIEFIYEKSSNFINEYLSKNNLNYLSKIYFDRLNIELNVINKMSFQDYFVLVFDIVKWARENKIPIGPGRGSCVGSLVIFGLEITEIDPIKYNLLFERFLNIDRIGWPDIDLDFCKIKRDLVIKYLSDKYSKNNTIKVAHIAAYSKMKFKSSFKDVARIVSQFKFQFINSLSKNFYDKESLSDYLNEKNRLLKIFKSEKNLNYDLIERHFHEFLSKKQSEIIDILEDIEDKLKYIKKIFDIAENLSNCIRGFTIHASGIIITNDDLMFKVPLSLNSECFSDVIVTQFEMSDLEYIGYVKFDILGLKSLTLIHDITNYLDFNFSSLNEDDILNNKISFNLLSNGYSKGIFQLETDLSGKFLQKMKPSSFDDIIALISLNRPGPMAFINTYIKRKHGLEPIEYVDNSLSKVLDSTYGIIVFQEQVMQISRIVSLYSLNEADILRKVIGKKLIHEMIKEKDKFIQGALENNFEKTKAEYIFNLIEKFANYGFNKSHAVPYAKISMMTAYLKSHFTIEFLSYSIFYDVDDTNKVIEFILDFVFLTQYILIYPIVGLSKLILTCYKKYVYLLPINILKGITEKMVHFSNEFNKEIYDAIDLIKTFNPPSLVKDNLKKFISIGIINIVNSNPIICVENYVENFNKNFKELYKLCNNEQLLIFDVNRLQKISSLTLFSSEQFFIDKIRRALIKNKFFDDNFYDLSGFYLYKINFLTIFSLLFRVFLDTYCYLFISCKEIFNFEERKLFIKLTLLQTNNIKKYFILEKDLINYSLLSKIENCTCYDLIFFKKDFRSMNISFFNFTQSCYSNNIPVLFLYEKIYFNEDNYFLINLLGRNLNIELFFDNFDELCAFSCDINKKLSLCFLNNKGFDKKILIKIFLYIRNDIDVHLNVYYLFNVAFDSINFIEFYLNFYKFLYVK